MTKAKFYKEIRNRREYWVCELWRDGVFLSTGSGTSQDSAKKNAVQNYHIELEKYEQTHR